MLRPLLLVSAAVVATAAGVAAPRAERAVPPPESVLGFPPCADYRLAGYDTIAEYLRLLDTASDRLQLIDIGRTTEGRPQILAVISSEANLNALPKYKAIARSLALNRTGDGQPLTDETARALAHTGKVVVWVSFGLHSTETASGQSAPWFVWRAVTDESPEMRTVRDNVILVVAPDLNPDGSVMVADWYRRHAGTPWELSPPSLYHRYAGHDNNRDWFMFTQVETQNVARQLYQELLPQIVLDHHQTAPFPARIFVPPFAAPANAHIPSGVLQGVATVGTAISNRLVEEGKTGAISGLEFDMSWNGGMRTAPYFHNMVGVLTETAHTTPTPADYNPATFPRTFSNGQPTLESRPNYPHPFAGGRWTLRNSCDYIVSSSLAVLTVAAERREQWLLGAQQMAREAIRQGAHETYVIPSRQWDPAAAVHLVNTLRLGGIEIERATAAFQADGDEFGAGSYIVRGAQPFLAFIRDLLTPQHKPESHAGGPEASYDITGWTLSLQMGVDVRALHSVVAARTERVGTAVVPRGEVRGVGRAYAIDTRSNSAFLAANRLLRQGDRVFRSVSEFGRAYARWPAGTFVVQEGPGTRERLARVAADLGITAVAVAELPAAVVRVDHPRIGLYAAWGGNTDEGWMRWLLDQYEFGYSELRDGRLRRGSLRSEFDVILLPDASYREMVSGIATRVLPDEYVGGMTPRGVDQLRQFVEDGGTLVAHDAASELPLRAFDLPVADTVHGVSPTEFRAPGSLVRILVDTRHPLGWGMPAETVGFVDDSPVFETPPGLGLANRVVVYPRTDVVRSGWVVGERYLYNKAAVVETPLGRGRVVLLGLRTQHRGQPHGTFKLLFNALFLGSTGRPATSVPELDARVHATEKSSKWTTFRRRIP